MRTFMKIHPGDSVAVALTPLSAGTALAAKKRNWIDFNCGVLVEDGTVEELGRRLFDFFLETASGKQVKAEETGYSGCLLEKAPEKAVQFGEGNFLRTFVDYWFDVANEKADRKRVISSNARCAFSTALTPALCWEPIWRALTSCVTACLEKVRTQGALQAMKDLL